MTSGMSPQREEGTFVQYEAKIKPCTCFMYLLGLVKITDPVEEVMLLLLKARQLNLTTIRESVSDLHIWIRAQSSSSSNSAQNPQASETIVALGLNNATNTGLKFQTVGDKAKCHCNPGSLFFLCRRHRATSLDLGFFSLPLPLLSQLSLLLCHAHFAWRTARSRTMF